MDLPTTIEHGNQRVMTTAQLAEKYGVDTKSIRDNFSNNKNRYVEGKHYYCLKGAELRAFRSETENLGFAIPKNANRFYLWTERGALLHAKSLGTDMAWEVYDFLVENYFNVRQIAVPTDEIRRLEAEAKAIRARAMLINAENRRMKMLLKHPEMGKLSQPALETLALKTFEQATGQDVGNALPVVEQTYSATEVGEMLGGISANKIGKTANAHGLKTEEYGEFVMDKSRYSSKQMPSFRYNRRGVEKLAEILGVAVNAA